MTDRSGVNERGLALPDFCAASTVLALVITVELFVLIIQLGAFGLRGFSWEFLAMMSFLAQWIAMSSAFLLCRLRGWLLTQAAWRAVCACFGLVLSVTLVCSLPADWILAGMPQVPVWSVLDWSNVLRNLLLAGIVTGMALRYFAVQSELRQQEQAELRSRVMALQSKIRPHFLFNSMNTIASLIGSRPELAEAVVEDLSELFRSSLSDELGEVSLGEELQLCRQYLHVESLRLGERLRVEWDLDDVPMSLQIPQFTLQPLLENALYHGIEPLPEGGVVRVSARLDGGMLLIELSNPVSGRSRSGRGNRMALENIRGRLLALYGERAAVDTETVAGHFRVRLQYPVATRDDGE